MTKFNFPKIEQVIIRNFSIYSKNGKPVEVNEKVNSGVFCLAVANGLGKTTFLNIINFGLTGLVLISDRAIHSPHEIQKENGRFTDTFFNGRVKDVDKENSEIELLIKVNERYYRICRSFFARGSLKTLEVYKTHNTEKFSEIETNNLSPVQLNELYQKEIVKDMGITDFDYFTFFQLYILTFDENRRLIFWDDRASSHTLSIAFNTDLAAAGELIAIGRKMDKLESDGRNNRWQATQIKNKIDQLYKPQAAYDPDVENEYIGICKELDEVQTKYNGLNLGYDGLQKNRNYLYAEIMDLRQKYKEYYSAYSEPLSSLLNNNIISQSLIDEECLICGAKGKHIVETIQENIHKGICPLCSTLINDENGQKDEMLSRIKENDAAIAKKEKSLEDIIAEIEGQKKLLEKHSLEIVKLTNRKNKIEKTHPMILNANSRDDSVVKDLEKQFSDYDEKSKSSYSKRDALKPKLIKLQKNVKKVYTAAEKDFVPIFKKLAKSFIGEDLSISFGPDGRNLKLILELSGVIRAESVQLSESQRFFLDIALRMALVIYLSKEGNGATMFIDTPEGSLDIAYESRVGSMFAEFVKEYSQNILMTANINASQLLLSLAANCGNQKMSVKRMLDWVDLSTVQKEGEELFKKVFRGIEQELQGAQNE